MSPISSVTKFPSLSAIPSQPQERGTGFGAVFSEALNEVESARAAATSATNDLLFRGQGDVHQVALATQQAELSFELFQQVRNKVVQAYQEVMKTAL